MVNNQKHNGYLRQEFTPTIMISYVPKHNIIEFRPTEKCNTIPPPQPTTITNTHQTFIIAHNFQQ